MAFNIKNWSAFKSLAATRTTDLSSRLSQLRALSPPSLRRSLSPLATSLWRSLSSLAPSTQGIALTELFCARKKNKKGSQGWNSPHFLRSFVRLKTTFSEENYSFLETTLYIWCRELLLKGKTIDCMFCQKVKKIFSILKAAPCEIVSTRGQPYWSFPFSEDSGADALRLKNQLKMIARHFLSALPGTD
jgi:hypothetical protein